MRDETAGWLTTERLALRRFTEADLDWLASLYADVEFARYLGGVKTRVQTANLLAERMVRYYDEHPGFGIWVTLDRATSAPVGFHLLNNIQGESIIQVGFGLSPAAQGKGLATEMSLAILRYGFEELALERIVGMANQDNLPSQRVLEKIGL